LKPVISDAEVADARREHAAGTSIREIAERLGLADHSGLARRIRAAERAEQQAALRAAAQRNEARAARAAIPEVAQGMRPETAPGERVLVAADVAPPEPRPVAVHPAPAPEISPEEYVAQKIEASDVAAGRRTAAEVRAARAAGRRPFKFEPPRYGPSAEPRGLCMSNVQLLRHAIAGRV
jgi:hypothetical protein